MIVRVAIIGPTGYTGLELILWLLHHPGVRLTYLGSRREEKTDIREVFPRLAGTLPDDVAICRPIDPPAIAREADLAFVALPHGVSVNHVPGLLHAGVRVIDLSADYRLRDPDEYARVYGLPHTDTENLSRAVYGVPELFREQIRDAALVANPGCYPTAAGLAVTPLLRHGLIKHEPVTINAASGVTGAGKKLAPHLMFAEQSQAFGPYGKIGSHRHQPEIAQTLATIAGYPVPVLFVPHLLPINRGIFETIYLEPNDPQISDSQIIDAMKQTYQDEFFVRVREDLPNIMHVVGTNFCDLTARVVGAGEHRKVVVFSAIDNLVKGASGQAMQNMNLMVGFDETTGFQATIP